MKILVCGGRKFNDREMLFRYMDEVAKTYMITHVIHGDYFEGADRLVDLWASSRGIQPVRCPALWTMHGRSAGPIRNRAMAALGPNMVIAFPGGKGTEDMWSVAEANEIQRVKCMTLP